MDKRTLLAFGLIGIIIFLMPHYFRMINPPPVEDPFLTEQEPLPEQELSTPQTIAPAPDSPGTLDRPTPPPEVDVVAPSTSSAQFEAKDILIETDRYIATISTRGGLITSWRLKDYFNEHHQNLELVGQGRGGLTTKVSGQSLDDLEFAPSTEAIFIQGDDQAELTLTSSLNGNTVTKRLLFQGNRYRAELSLFSEGLTAQDWMSIGWDGGLADTEGGTTQGGMYASATDLIVTLAGEEVTDWTVESINEEDATMPGGRSLNWVVIRNAYFASALMPRDDVIHDVHLEGSTEDLRSHYGTEIRAQYAGEPISFGLMVGPLSYSILQQQEKDLYGRDTYANLEELVQFGWAFIRPILRPMTILCIHAFSALHNVLPNYGFVIMVFSIVVKVFLFPLTRKSTESMAKMQEIQPLMTTLREKHANDQQKLNTEMMKLYKDQGVNPLGGCLPLFLQAPIMFSLFNLFRNAIELRQSEFLFWITDLSKPDVLVVGGYDLHVLPLLMSAAMFVQQKLTMKDPKQAAMVYIMPVFMIWIFWSMSSGLVLYFTMYNLLSLFEQQALKRFKSEPAAA
jgi:YidC/Oxa1 family membrane protein insertase